MLNLNPNHLILIKKILETHAKGWTVWAYGSRVKGSSHDGSDLDLVILDTQKNFPSESLSLLRSAFSGSHLPISVDVLSWSMIPDTFKQEISKMHEIVQ